MGLHRAISRRWAIRLETASLLVVYAAGTALAAWVWWPLGVAYLGYCAVANLLFMARICPYCLHCQTRSCHSGYHHIAKWFKAKDGKNFADQFRRNVVVMYPIWFLPPVAGVYLLVTGPSWLRGVLMGLFCVSGFVLVPYASRQICGGCANAENCPRQGRRSAGG